MPKIRYKSHRFSDTSKAVINMANQILREYEQQGYDLTLRQLYYQFVSRGLIPNSDREYKKLGSVVNDARLAGLIDWKHIVDRTRFLREVNSWGSPSKILESVVKSYQRDLWRDQPTRIEVWVEKDALVGVIERACKDLRVPFLSCRGYTSQSEMWGASQRLYRHTLKGQKVLVLHLGDHDPSGIDMSRDIEDRIRLFMATDYYHASDKHVDAGGAWDWVGENFRIDRLALNYDQVLQYDPPPNPAKLTDSRGRAYIEEYGSESWELDALEPTVIGELIGEAVIAEIDGTKWSAAIDREDTERAGLALAADNWGKVQTYLASLTEED